MIDGLFGVGRLVLLVCGVEDRGVGKGACVTGKRKGNGRGEEGKRERESLTSWCFPQIFNPLPVFLDCRVGHSASFFFEGIS